MKDCCWHVKNQIEQTKKQSDIVVEKDDRKQGIKVIKKDDKSDTQNE